MFKSIDAEKSFWQNQTSIYNGKSQESGYRENVQ